MNGRFEGLRLVALAAICCFGAAFTSWGADQISTSPCFITPQFAQPEFVKAEYVKPLVDREDFIRREEKPLSPDYVRPQYITPEFEAPKFITPVFQYCSQQEKLRLSAPIDLSRQIRMSNGAPLSKPSPASSAAAEPIVTKTNAYVYVTPPKPRADDCCDAGLKSASPPQTKAGVTEREAIR